MYNFFIYLKSLHIIANIVHFYTVLPREDIPLIFCYTQAPIGLVKTIRTKSVGYELNSEFRQKFSKTDRMTPC